MTLPDGRYWYTRPEWPDRVVVEIKACMVQFSLDLYPMYLNNFPADSQFEPAHSDLVIGTIAGKP